MTNTLKNKYVLNIAWSMLLLLSRFSRVRLPVTPWTAAYKAPPSMGFSRQEYWSGLPLPSPCMEYIYTERLFVVDMKLKFDWVSFIFICQIWQFNLGSSVNLSKSLLLFESQFPSIGASLVVQMVKNLPAMWETWVQSLGREDPLENGMATHTSILAWRIPWIEEPGKLQSMGSKIVG